ncbi:MAG: NADH dehydrogenase [Clostridia bacterium]|nr:NADH dehydrogenase [Clostridia bacterium]
MDFSMLLLLLVLFPPVSATVTYALGKSLKHHPSASNATRCILISLSCALELAAAILLLLYGNGTTLSLEIAHINLSFDALRAIYTLVTVFMWFGSSLLIPQYFRHRGISDRFCFFFLLILGTTLGIFLSADLLTTYVFLEMTSLAVYAWIAEKEDVGSLKAGKAYLTLTAISGAIALFGILLLYHCVGTLHLAELRAACSGVENRAELYAAAFCILIGFGTKAGLFPTPSRLPLTHSIAPTPASALLSGVIMKTGIFGILIVSVSVLPGDIFWGELLLVIGAITMLGGALLALFSVQLKRTLACSSISQIGFITIGIAMICLSNSQSTFAANGTILYMLNHSLSKLVLFLTAGAIYAMAHTLDLNELRGFGRRKPLLGAIFLIGGASLAGIPGTLGYLANTLIHESIVEYAAYGGVHITVFEWLFLLSGGLTAAYVTKLFVAIFVERPLTAPEHPGHGKARLTPLSWLALLLGALPILLFGCTPHTVAERISAFGLSFVGGEKLSHAVEYLSWGNLHGICISLSIGAAVYFLVVRKALMKLDEHRGIRIYVNRLPSKLSSEHLSYAPLAKLFVNALKVLARFLSALPEKLMMLPLRLVRLAYRSIRGLLRRTTRIGRKPSHRKKNGK